jgi:hypothetical protein
MVHLAIDVHEKREFELRDSLMQMFPNGAFSYRRHVHQKREFALTDSLRQMLPNCAFS